MNRTNNHIIALRKPKSISFFSIFPMNSSTGNESVYLNGSSLNVLAIKPDRKTNGMNSPERSDAML